LPDKPTKVKKEEVVKEEAVKQPEVKQGQPRPLNKAERRAIARENWKKLNVQKTETVKV